jgi:hypothetical protein
MQGRRVLRRTFVLQVPDDKAYAVPFERLQSDDDVISDINQSAK